MSSQPRQFYKIACSAEGQFERNKNRKNRKNKKNRKGGKAPFLDCSIEQFEDHLNNLPADTRRAGYASFCHHLIIPKPDFVTAKVNVVPLTDENRCHLKAGFVQRKEGEVPMFTQWLEAEKVDLPEADYLDVVVYSAEQMREEQQVKGGSDSADYSDDKIAYVVLVKPQCVDYEQPMPAETLLRNTLGAEEGGSGVKFDRTAYKTCVAFWMAHAIVKEGMDTPHVTTKDEQHQVPTVVEEVTATEDYHQLTGEYKQQLDKYECLKVALKSGDDKRSIQFGSNLDARQRRLLHLWSGEYGLASKGHGQRDARYLVVSRKDRRVVVKPRPSSRGAGPNRFTGTLSPEDPATSYLLLACIDRLESEKPGVVRWEGDEWSNARFTALIPQILRAVPGVKLTSIHKEQDNVTFEFFKHSGAYPRDHLYNPCVCTYSEQQMLNKC